MSSVELSALSCPFCQTQGPRSRYRFAGCSIVRCSACELMWLYPVPSLDDLRSVYGEHYFSNAAFLQNSNHTLYGYFDYMSERINKQYGYRAVVRRAHQLLGSVEPGSRPRWLDVGCGFGYLLDVAFDHGFQVKGLEFNPAAVANLRAKYTFSVDEGQIGDLADGERYDVISLLDVIEHLRDPFADLARLRTLMNPGGCLVLSTMDSDSLVSRLLGSRLEDFRRTREHLFFFSRKTIRQALERCGWEPVDIRSVGHTFQVKALLSRAAMIWPMTRPLRSLVYPRWLLEANLYVNPGTKMLVYARPADR